MINQNNHRHVHNGIWQEVRGTNIYSKRDSPALFIDRDGTIIQLIDYLNDPKLVYLIPEIISIISIANKKGIKVIMITNQSGISRGYFDWDKFASVQNVIINKCKKIGATFDGIYACPDHPDKPTKFRKPNPGMLFAAQIDLKIDLSKSFIIGNQLGGGGPQLNLIANKVRFSKNCAIVNINNNVIIITKNRQPFHYLNDFKNLNIDINNFNILVVKQGYLSPELYKLSQPNFMLLSDGAVNQNIIKIKNHNRLMNTYPFKQINKFKPKIIF